MTGRATGGEATATRLRWVYDDGGRAQAGFKGEAGDCAVRAAAIASGVPYRVVYDRVNALARSERRGTRKRGVSSARGGVYKQTFAKLMTDLGFTFVPTMGIGTGCQVHMRPDELPMGRIVCHVSRHYVAVVDRVIHDTHDPSSEGTRCVYGYWRKELER